MNLKKLTLTTTITLLIILNAIVSAHFQNVEAQTVAFLFTEPYPATQEPGKHFTITIEIKDTPKIYAWYINFTWNPTILELVEAAEGPFLNQEGTRKTDFITRINNTAGYIYFGCALKGEPSSAQPSGSGVLSELTFNVLNIGESPLHLDSVSLFDYWYPTTPAKSYTTRDGYFKFPYFTVSIQPQYVHEPLEVEEKFNVSISAYVENLFSWNATVSWNSTIIEATGIFEGPFLNMNETQGTQFTYEIFENYTIINGTLISPAQPVNSTADNPGTLAILEFKVKALGCSDITLEDINLLDINETIIGRRIVNGRFSNIWRDVKIENVEVSTATQKIAPGQNVTVTVSVKNMGNIPENVELRLYANLTLIGSQAISLDPNQTATLTFNWNTSSLVAGTYQVKASIDPVPEEVNVENNIALATVQVETSTFPLPIEMVTVIVIVVVAVVAVALTLKRRRKS
jgi:hypothetical protein